MNKIFLEFMELIYPLLKRIYPSDKVLKDIDVIKILRGDTHE